MNLSRRDFLGGALASMGLAMFGGRVFAAPSGWKPKGKARIVFGVLSDTHFISSRRAVETLVWNRSRGKGSTETGSPNKYFLAALRYFRERKVDAVMNCGDLADQGLVSEMQWTADAWHEVFPANKGKCGGVVEKLFVTGNHDIEGMWRVTRDYPDAADRARRMLNTDMAGHWQRIWGEPYEEAWHKEIKGYHFFGRNWGGKANAKFTGMLAESAPKFGLNDGVKPFFCVSHGGYFYRPDKAMRDAMRPYCRNGVAFFGHHHCSISNWKYISFSVSKDFPEIQCPPCGPFRGTVDKCNRSISDQPLLGAEATGFARQGFVVCVYDDMVVIERRDFNNGGDRIGPDWVMPLGESGAEPHPLSSAGLKKAIGKPQFAKRSKLRIEPLGGAEGGMRISIPPADGNPDSQAYAYEVVVTGGNDSAKFCRAVYASGCNLGIGHRPNGGVTMLEIAGKNLPSGDRLVVVVRACTSLGTHGSAISASVPSSLFSPLGCKDRALRQRCEILC